MKGDTIEYDASAFEIRPNDKVEDLLKRLPGIQVDGNGRITAQGQAVGKVLLDGEEFFADDPTLITRNVRADMVDKIQVYEKKSARAELTGIDDGNTTRTLNVTLKEDKKNGMFGKVTAGRATDGYYEGQGMINRFKHDHKFSAYGTLANNGSTGISQNSLGSLSIQPAILLGQGVAHSSLTNAQLETYDGNYTGIGLPTVKRAGAHYDTKWAEGRRYINADYQLAGVGLEGHTTGLIQQNLAADVLDSRIDERSDKYSAKQKMNVAYRMALGASSELKINVAGGNERFDLDNRYTSLTTDGQGQNINAQDRSVINSGDQRAINLEAYYSKKFSKERRSLSWTINGNIHDNQTEGYLRARADFYHTDGSINSSEQVNQMKVNDVGSQSWSTGIEYTEPLLPWATLLLKYGVAANRNTTDQRSFNYVEGQGYTDLDDNFSNHYRLGQLANQGGARLNFNYLDKIYFNVGTDATAISFRQQDLSTATGTYERDFLNWSPEMYLHWYIKRPRFLSASYKGSNTLPTLAQLQPVLNNTDPLNIHIGNPDLKPSFTNQLDVHFSDNNRLTGKYTYLRFYYSATQNAITDDITTDAATGKTQLGYVNLSENVFHNYRAYADFTFPLGSPDARLGMGVETRRDVSFSLINSVLNKASTGSYSGSVSIYRHKPDKYELYVSFKPDYSINRLTLQPEYNNDAVGYGASGSVKTYLPAQFELATDIDYNYRRATALFPKFERTTWNASLSRAFLKGKNLKFSLSAHDLLNQNQRLDRSVARNTYRQFNYAVIRRHVMFSITWDFTKFATLPTSNP